MHVYQNERWFPGRFAHAFHGGFGKHGLKNPLQFAGQAWGFGPGRARRGDVRDAILRLLAEQPMHGYQIIQELAARSDGAWTPSAGSVYPTLQLLADEGLVTAEETAGKKVFELTDNGVAAAAAAADRPAPWEEATRGEAGFGDFRESASRLMLAVFQIGKSGTSGQRAAALEILNDARKKLYAILAED